MTPTTRRLLAGLALPVGLVTLAACGPGSTSTTSTSTAAALSETTSPETSTATTSGPAEPTGSTAGQTSGTSAPTADDDDDDTTHPGSARADVPSSFTAFGTEPFWDLQVTGTTLTYSNPETSSVVLNGSRQDAGGAAVYTGTHNGQRFTLTVKPGDCSDGMSDDTHEYTSTFQIDGRDLSGCARD